ncbi:WD repeat-containing protein DWA2-like [Amaranthus tricolor]|uniref:WD repeat-containing protein DWA2-like n=1 Tax=Amaranthus tricolor TaxID=29722 RepID=UPI00258BAE55|nr:WD repeat-containing protein DWA2-like [Amaranthus tricolor]XP_057546976.1 WD repeat-containing protein DWA2-like [Amaranthus tricolor]
MLKAPITELPGHDHWAWTFRSNPEYGGLILSAGTDSSVSLWSAPTHSEDARTESLVESTTNRAEPSLQSYSDYEDSVYGLAWSSREPWHTDFQA